MTIPAGTRVQSVPDPGQEAQTFETTVPITARVEWNAIPARTSRPPAIGAGLTELDLAGTSLLLQPGDAILIVGSARVTRPESTRWDVRAIERVEADLERNLTRVGWGLPLGAAFASAPPGEGVHVFALRQRAALFGAAAPDPRLVRTDANAGLFDASLEWKGFAIEPATHGIDLDAAYPRIVPGSWLALRDAEGSGAGPVVMAMAAAGPPSTAAAVASGSFTHVIGEHAPLVALFRVTAVAPLSRADFGLTARITRVRGDVASDLSGFGRRTTEVLAQSEELVIAERPLRHPVCGSTLVLGRREPELAPKQLLAVSGKRPRVAIPAETAGIEFRDDPARQAAPGDSYRLLRAPERRVGAEWVALDPEALEPTAPRRLGAAPIWRWTLLDRDGATVRLLAPAGRLRLQRAAKDDETLSEVVAVGAGADAVRLDRDTTTLALATALENRYDRASVAVNANVAPGTHGESVSEIAGGGDASQATQRFPLRQPPLTHVSSGADPSGAASTLEVRVNDLRWRERPTLYGSGPRDRVYTLRLDDEGGTTVEFGDGRQGARLPSAQQNVRFSYRKGIGSGGNLRTGQLTTLLTRPLGVRSVTNASPARGGQDAETLDGARRNAPVRVLTLDRAVSVRDYADFARAYAGVAKSHAAWIDGRRGRGVHVTVAGPAGAAIPEGGATGTGLVAALRRFGDPLLPLTVRSYARATFRIDAVVEIAPDADPEKTLAAVEAALRAAYSFEARDFGQPVALDEVYAVIQGVAGVVAADVRRFWRTNEPPPPRPAPRLFAALPTVKPDGSVPHAELLTLDPGPLELGRKR